MRTKNKRACEKKKIAKSGKDGAVYCLGSGQKRLLKEYIQDIANVVKHLHRAGIVVLLLVSKEQAASIEKKHDTYISGWLEEGTDANAAAKFILKNSAFRDVESRNRDFI